MDFLEEKRNLELRLGQLKLEWRLLNRIVDYDDLPPNLLRYTLERCEERLLMISALEIRLRRLERSYQENLKFYR